MSLNTVDIVNAATLEKVVLAKRISAFLRDDHSEEERATVENVARMLAQDIALQVRETLAFELRTCHILPYDLAAKIASDVESVACPFLASTLAFTDMQLAGLVPHLEEYAHITIARRPDLGPQTCQAIVTVGSDRTATYVVRNDHITISEQSLAILVRKHSENQDVMDHLSRREDLPLSVVEMIMHKVSAECRSALVEHYKLDQSTAEEIAGNSMFEAMWRQLEKANPSQVHAYVIDLKRSGRLTHDLTKAISARGCLTFLESVLALETGLTLGAVREVLYAGDTKAFVSLMQRAKINKTDAQDYHRIVKNQ